MWCVPHTLHSAPATTHRCAHALWQSTGERMRGNGVCVGGNHGASMLAHSFNCPICNLTPINIRPHHPPTPTSPHTLTHKLWATLLLQLVWQPAQSRGASFSHAPEDFCALFVTIAWPMHGMLSCANGSQRSRSA